MSRRDRNEAPLYVPPRKASVYLSPPDVEFDVDIGELVEGHRVIARGLQLGGEGAEGVLLYDFVPGIRERPDQRLYWYWMLSTEDDVGTEYGNNNGGAFKPGDGLAMSDGIRDLGAEVPNAATRLTIRFSPAFDWRPPRPYVAALTVDLRTKDVKTTSSNTPGA